jgi:diacylglycerol kinase family enzyme
METPADGAAGATPTRPAPTVHRRLAAATALIALPLALALAIDGLLHDPLRLPLAVLLILGAVIAGWTALIHRGAARATAAAAAVVAVLGLAGLLVFGSPLRLAVLVGLVLLATAAAGVALGRDMADTRYGLRNVGPASHGILIMNRWSGGGKVDEFGLEAEARRRGVAPVPLQPGEDLRALAEQAVARGADVIGVAGGDGSQALVADVARQHDVAFVCIPAGTCNHFALDLGLDRTDVVAALDAYGTAIERRVDLALIGDRVFVNNASLGAYATVQSDAYRGARLDLRHGGPHGELVPTADLLHISNGGYRLESLKGFGIRERLDAGVLGITTVVVERAGDLPGLLTAEAGGRLERFHGYRSWTTPEFEVTSSEPVIDVGLDGEVLRLRPPLRFRSLPGALRVRTPVHAPGVAPAALAPAGFGKACVALLQVLTGHHPAR